MRLKHGSGIEWVGRFGPYTVRVRLVTNRPLRYTATLTVSPGYIRRFSARTLRKAKAKLTTEWLDRRLCMICEARPEALALVAACRRWSDALAVMALADWLEENGEDARGRMIVTEGKRAGVKWPAEWAVLAERFTWKRGS